ncbi:MAG: hypothetical protein AAF512_12010, partial [Pseudomonadota bacterium]
MSKNKSKKSRAKRKRQTQHAHAAQAKVNTTQKPSQEPVPRHTDVWCFAPIDSWFFRESRPHGSIGGSELDSLFPPPARTIAAIKKPTILLSEFFLGSSAITKMSVSTKVCSSRAST